jgi:hypothetical protein
MERKMNLWEYLMKLLPFVDFSIAARLDELIVTSQKISENIQLRDFYILEVRKIVQVAFVILPQKGSEHESVPGVLYEITRP